MQRRLRRLRRRRRHARRSKMHILVQVVTSVFLVELLRNEVRLIGSCGTPPFSLSPRRLLLVVEHFLRWHHLQALLSYFTQEVYFLLIEYFTLPGGLATSGSILQLVVELLLLPVFNIALFERLLHDLVVSS